MISKEKDGLTCTIISGGILLDRKGVNVPGVSLNVPFISEQDREDIIYACKHDGDYLALSFVDEKEDVLQVREILKEQQREDMLIISKIESETAIDNIDEIIEKCIQKAKTKFALKDNSLVVVTGSFPNEIAKHRTNYLKKEMIS